MSAGRFGTDHSDAPNNSAYGVNKFDRASNILPRLQALLAPEAQAPASPRKPQKEPPAGRKPGRIAPAQARFAADLEARQHARRLAAADVFEARRRTATAALDRLDRLPDGHAAAAWRLVESYTRQQLASAAGFPSRERVRLDLIGCSVQGDHAPLTIGEAAARVVDEIHPPDGEDAAQRGLWLVRGDEYEIRAMAEMQAAKMLTAAKADPARPATVAAWMDGCTAVHALAQAQPVDIAAVMEAGSTADPLPTDWEFNQSVDPAHWVRVFRRDAKAAQAWSDCCLRMAKPSSPAVSGYTLGAYRQRMLRNVAWASTQAVAFEDGTMVPLITVQSNAKRARRAQLYTTAKAMEYFGEENDYVAFFITLTLPGEFHPYTSDERAADGSYPNARPNPGWNPLLGPRAQGRELTHRLARVRAMLAKRPEMRAYFGMVTVEPHKNGTPHYHAMMWLPRTHTHREQVHDSAQTLTDIVRHVAPGRESRIEVVRKRADEVLPDGSIKRFATPASYVMKYLLKADASGEGGGEAWERHRAWLSSRGLKSMRFLGVHGSLRIWQRIWSSSDKEELPRRASLARSAMRRAAAAGERATVLPMDSQERGAERREQAAAAAEALQLIGGLPGGDGCLKLAYEDAETRHGKPSRKASGIVDPATGNVFPLHRQTAQIVDLPTERDATEELVTVVAIGPRRHSVPELDAVAEQLEVLIRARHNLPQWSRPDETGRAWLVDAHARLDRLRRRS